MDEQQSLNNNENDSVINVNPKALQEACLVVNALGPQARKDLLDEFVQLQMLPYEKYFAVGKPYFGLDHVRMSSYIYRI